MGFLFPPMAFNPVAAGVWRAQRLVASVHLHAPNVLADLRARVETPQQPSDAQLVVAALNSRSIALLANFRGPSQADWPQVVDDFLSTAVLSPPSRPLLHRLRHPYFRPPAIVRRAIEQYREDPTQANCRLLFEVLAADMNNTLADLEIGKLHRQIGRYTDATERHAYKAAGLLRFMPASYLIPAEEMRGGYPGSANMGTLLFDLPFRIAPPPPFTDEAAWTSMHEFLFRYQRAEAGEHLPLRDLNRQRGTTVMAIVDKGLEQKTLGKHFEVAERFAEAAAVYYAARSYAFGDLLHHVAGMNFAQEALGWIEKVPLTTKLELSDPRVSSGMEDDVALALPQVEHCFSSARSSLLHAGSFLTWRQTRTALLDTLRQRNPRAADILQEAVEPIP